MDTDIVFRIELLSNLERFLQTVEGDKNTVKDDVLISACESKEYLSDFFYSFTSQFCRYAFGIKEGSSLTEYSIKLKDETIFKDKDHEDILRHLVRNIRDILYGRSDYLEQEYLETPHEFEEFIYIKFPELLNGIQAYLKALGDSTYDSKLTLICKSWEKVFK